MRILFVIPHYYGPGPIQYGSTDVSQRKRRAESLQTCIASLHQQFGQRQYLLLHDGQARNVNQQNINMLDIVICVTGTHHLLDDLVLPQDSFRTHSCELEDPRFLGFTTYDVYRESVDKYDWYCYLEDDVVINDPLFFYKLDLFYTTVADARYLLQPSRFELGAVSEPGKTYIDGPLWADSAKFMKELRLPGCKDEIRIPFGEFSFRMTPAENPHSGCFFLTPAHLLHMLEQPWYGESAVGYAGPLESAATMYIMTLFHVFKPADECISFLEVHHNYQKYVKDQIYAKTN